MNVKVFKDRLDDLNSLGFIFICELFMINIGPIRFYADMKSIFTGTDEGWEQFIEKVKEAKQQPHSNLGQEEIIRRLRVLESMNFRFSGNGDHLTRRDDKLFTIQTYLYLYKIEQLSLEDWNELLQNIAQ